MPDMVLDNTLCKSVFYTCKMCKMFETSKSLFFVQKFISVQKFFFDPK